MLPFAASAQTDALQASPCVSHLSVTTDFVSQNSFEINRPNAVSIENSKPDA